MTAIRHDIIYSHEKQISVHVKDNNKGNDVNSHYSIEISPSRGQMMRDGKSVVKGKKAELKDKALDSKRQHVEEMIDINRRTKTRDNLIKPLRPDSRLERKRDTAGRENFNQTRRDQTFHLALRPKSARPDSRMLKSKVENDNHLLNEHSELFLDNIQMTGRKMNKTVESQPSNYHNNVNVNPKSFSSTRYEQINIAENDSSNKFTRFQHISFYNEGQENSSQGQSDTHNFDRINGGSIKLNQHKYLAPPMNFEDSSRKQQYSRNPHERKVEPMDLTTEFHNEDLNIDPVEYFWRETESCSDYNCSFCRQKQQKALLMPQTKVHERNESKSIGELVGGIYSNHANKTKQFLATDIGFHRNRSSSLQIPRSQAYANNVPNQQTVFPFRSRIKSDTEAQKSITRDVDFDIEDPYAGTCPPCPPAKDKTFISSKNHKSRKQSLPFPSHPVYHKMSLKVVEKNRHIRPATFTDKVVEPPGDSAPEPDFSQLKPRKLKPIRMPIQPKKT